MFMCMEKCAWVSKYNFVVLFSIIFVPFGSDLMGRQTATYYCLLTLLFYVEVVVGVVLNSQLPSFLPSSLERSGADLWHL